MFCTWTVMLRIPRMVTMLWRCSASSFCMFWTSHKFVGSWLCTEAAAATGILVVSAQLTIFRCLWQYSWGVCSRIQGFRLCNWYLMFCNNLVVSSCKDQNVQEELHLDILALEDKTIMLSQNVGNWSPSDAASHSRRTSSLNAQFVAINHCMFVLVVRKLWEFYCFCWTIVFCGMNSICFVLRSTLQGSKLILCVCKFCQKYEGLPVPSKLHVMKSYRNGMKLGPLLVGRCIEYSVGWH